MEGRGKSDAERSIYGCVCCWPPARPRCPNHEVVDFQPWTVTDPDLGSGANAYTISNPPHQLFQPCYGSFVTSHRTNLLSHPHISPVNTASLSLCARFSPLHIAQSRSDHPPGRRPRPLAATACVRFPSLLGGPKEFLA